MKKSGKKIVIKSEEYPMKNVRIFFRSLGTGTLFVLICFIGIIPILLAWNGISCFPFISDPVIQNTLVVSLMFFIFAIAGLVLLIRIEKRLWGIAISVFAVLWIIINLYIGLIPVIKIFIH